MSLHLGQLHLTAREASLLLLRHSSRLWFRDAGARAYRALPEETRRAVIVGYLADNDPHQMLNGDPADD